MARVCIYIIKQTLEKASGDGLGNKKSQMNNNRENKFAFDFFF